MFVTGGNDSMIRIWNVLSYQLECELEGHGDSVTCMALDANFLFSGSDDLTIRVLNLVHVSEAYQLSVIQHAHTCPVQDILILEDTGHLVSCAFDGKLKVWDWGHEEEGESSPTTTTGKRRDAASLDGEDEDHGGEFLTDFGRLLFFNYL